MAKLCKCDVSVSVVKDGAHFKTMTFNYYRDENGTFNWQKFSMALLIGAAVVFSAVMILDVLFK